MEEIKVVVSKYRAKDGEVFSKKTDCLIHEISQDIKEGKKITVNEFLEITGLDWFMCETDEMIRFVHGIHKGKEETLSRCNGVSKDNISKPFNRLFNQKYSYLFLNLAMRLNNFD